MGRQLIPTNRPIARYDERRRTVMWEAAQRVLTASADDHQLTLLDVIPEVKSLVLSCANHGRFEVNWSYFRGTAATPGRRCPVCNPWSLAKYERYGFEEVVARAAAYGLKPGFVTGMPTSTRRVVFWQCVKHEGTTIKGSVNMMLAGRVQCPECIKSDIRKSTVDTARRMLLARGDKLSSNTTHYKDRNSRMRYVCGRCGSQCEGKLLEIVSRPHECDEAPQRAEVRVAEDVGN